MASMARENIQKRPLTKRCANPAIALWLQSWPEVGWGTETNSLGKI